MKTALIGVRVTAELKEKLQRIADNEMRTLNNLVKKILTEYVQEQEKSQAEPPNSPNL